MNKLFVNIALSLDGQWLSTGRAIHEVVAAPAGGCLAAVTFEVRDHPTVSLVRADLEHGKAEAGSDEARTTRLQCHLESIGSPEDPHFP